jgi:cysteine desulfurase
MEGYLDHAASAPMSEACRDAMLPWLGSHFGNPSGSHRIARAARAAIEDARDSVAEVLGVAARELVFTGGGTEAINLAISGTARPQPAHLITSAIEHDAVREAAAAQALLHGEQHTEARVLATGVIDIDSLHELIDPKVRLVAVMAVNNEIGTIQPITNVAEAVKANSDAMLLVDAVQGAVWLDLRALASAADLLVVSGHKFGGPQGVGVLRVREGTVIRPIVHGGGQERERRSGTQNVAGIAGFAAALREADAQRAELIKQIEPLRDRLVDGLLAAISDCRETTPRSSKVAGNAHLCVADVESESLLVLLDDRGICASAGSACASGAIHTSPVLRAIGVEDRFAMGALRLTLGTTTTVADIDQALRAVPEAVHLLRST